MAYIGNGPGTIRQGRRAVYEFTSTANQTAFSGTDENGLTLDLLQANDNDVYLNGVRLIITDDYTISGDVLTLTSGAASGDKLIIMTQDEIANDASYSKAASDSRYINYDGDIVNGTIQIGGSGNNITFADNNKAVFGDDSDLKIFHDGSDGFVTNDTGQLILRVASVESALVAVPNGAVTLYHDNSPKIATTSAGIDVTGTVTSDGLTVDVPGTEDIIFQRAGGVTGKLELDFSAQFTNFNSVVDGIKMYHGGTQVMQMRSGDISFYNAAGTDAKFFWDASTERLGIGTSSPSTTLEVNGYGKFTSSDNSPRLHLTGGRDYMLTTTAGGLFGLYDNTASSYRLAVDSSGNVGIGTTTPSAKLDVAGTLTSPKIETTEALPTIRPSLLLDFANSKALDPRITFARASSGTYWDGK